MASKLFPLLVAGGAALFLLPKKKKATRTAGKKPPEDKVHDLSSIYAENAALGASEYTMKAIRLPIGLSVETPDAETLSAVPGASRVESMSYRDPSEGTIIPITAFMAFEDGSWRIGLETGSGRIGNEGALESLGQLVTNLTPDASAAAFDTAQFRASAKSDVFDEPSGTMDAYVNLALRSYKPGIDWPTSIEGLKEDDPMVAVWRGMSLVGSLAYQTAVNLNA